MLPSNEPTLDDRDGVPTWVYPDGRAYPLIAGAEDDQTEGDGDGEGEGPAEDKSKGKDDGAAKALAAERDARRKADRRAREADKALADAQKRLEAIEGAKLSETERLQKELADLKTAQTKAETDAREVRIDASIAAAARAAGAIDPDAMSRLIDHSAIEFDDKGQPHNAVDLVDALKKQKPMWFAEGGPGSYDGGARGSSAGEKQDMESLLRAASGH